MADPGDQLAFPGRRDTILLLAGLVALWIGVVGSFVFMFVSGQPERHHSPMPPEYALLWSVAAVGGLTAAFNHYRAVKRLHAGAEPFPAAWVGGGTQAVARILGAAGSRLGSRRAPRWRSTWSRR